ncbi:MAG: YceD family protein [Oligoflexia bacterium]|nr:YceD family protein [Oligoflexia bacterium]
MKIRIADIGPEGLAIDDTLDFEALNQRMQEGHETDIRFTAAPKVSLHVTRTPSGADTKGKIKGTFTQGCSLCARDVPRHIEVSADYVLQQIHSKEFGQSPESLDDIGIVFFEGDGLDLRDTLEQSLILAMDQFWHPQLNQDGSCVHCGESHTAESAEQAKKSPVSLGELLAKAGVKGSSN